MGLCLCSSTKHSPPDTEENRFWVVNVNDSGKKICPGIMELTETSLIFHIKRGGFVKWPYTSLVKYGYDSNLFSFVCGRRCQTGEGIFGFRCNRAEEMFNLLQRCMQNNRISIISDTDCDPPLGVEKSLPYRYESYPSFPAASSVLSSSQRPEPIGSELQPGPLSMGPSEDLSTHMISKDVRGRQRFHVPLVKKVSDGGVSQRSAISYLEMSERCAAKSFSTYKAINVLDREELEPLGSLHSDADLNGAIWDTGYDSDERREALHIRRLGYENVSEILQGSTRSRSILVSVSSSDSQNTNFISTRMAADCFVSQPSSPSVFEEKCTIDQKTPYINENHDSWQAFKPGSGRDSEIHLESAPCYFNFDLRPPYQESKTLNYIQVELESGCDSDNPQTPQSPNGSLLWSTNHQTKCYAELDLEKTAALSLMQRLRPKEDGTRKTRHNSKRLPV
ncbi:fibroblast growth factor receptor substrate 2-like [Gastrophryne carolinensis]